MRIVMEYNPKIPALLANSSLPGRNDEIYCYNAPGSSQPWDRITNSYAELTQQYPAGWQPDVYFHAPSVEYYAVPRGLEEADCLTVGVVGDWNLGGQAIRQVGGIFDMLFADRNGCQRLRAAGFANVHYAPLWSFDPHLHRRLPEVERDIDIVMVGNFNHDVQQEREKWIARVARLSRRWHVCLTSGVFDAEYTRLMNRAKIVFNRSIRGEINMRAYEAPACGALLFYERENEEIGDLFGDGTTCVLYGTDDLEALLDYYLTHDAERERTAQAGHQAVQFASHTHHLAQILNTVEAEMSAAYAVTPDAGRTGFTAYALNPDAGRTGFAAHAAHSVRPRRSFLALPPGERHLRRAYHQMVLPDRRSLQTAEQELAQAQPLLPSRPDIMNAYACLLAEYARSLPDAHPERRGLFQQALRHTHQTVAMQPDYAVGWFNRAQILLALSDSGAAVKALGAAVQALHTDPLRAEQLRGPTFPRCFDGFVTELERIWITHTPESSPWTAAMRTLLLWRAWDQLSGIAFDFGRFQEAATFAADAVALTPNDGMTRFRLARALRGLGRRAEAEAAYRLAYEQTPLRPPIWEELASLLLETEQTTACQVFLADIQAIIDGCPYYAWWRPTLQTLQSSCAAL